MPAPAALSSAAPRISVQIPFSPLLSSLSFALPLRAEPPPPRGPQEPDHEREHEQQDVARSDSEPSSGGSVFGSSDSNSGSDGWDRTHAASSDTSRTGSADSVADIAGAGIAHVGGLQEVLAQLREADREFAREVARVRSCVDEARSWVGRWRAEQRAAPGTGFFALPAITVEQV